MVFLHQGYFFESFFILSDLLMGLIYLNNRFLNKFKYLIPNHILRSLLVIVS
mgnify:FL=1